MQQKAPPREDPGDFEYSPTRVLEAAEGAIRRIENAIFGVSCIAVLAMMVAIFADAACRYALNHPIVGTREIVTRYLMIATVWLAFSHTQRMQGHVAIDRLMSKAPRTVQATTRALTRLLGAGAAALLCAGALRPMTTKADAWTLGSLQIPLAPAWAMIVIGSAVLGARLVVEAIRSCVSLTNPSIPRPPEREDDGPREGRAV